MRYKTVSPAYAGRFARATCLTGAVALWLFASPSWAQAGASAKKSLPKKQRPEIILIDGLDDGSIYSPDRSPEGGRNGSNVDDLYLALQDKPYMLDAEVRHSRWDRLEYIKARSPRVIIVGSSAFAGRFSYIQNYTYSVNALTTKLVEPLALTNVKFLVYYRNESNFDRGPDISAALCDAIKKECNKRISVVNAGSESFPSPAFIAIVGNELERLLK